MRRALALAFLLTLPFSASATEKVDGGVIDGRVLPSGVRAWFGVPFAAPPVRELRWRPPQPVPTWPGVFHADRFAPMCLQPVRGRTMNHYFGNEAISEDCLYLNVWAPRDASPKGKAYPVIVWIYGGAFNVGSASMANYSGEFLAQKNVVYVSIAYRVGALGFLSHPELSRESGYGGSGNYGLMDQIAGLQWVQRNIAAFGGDPDKVTIAGQSAGSTSVALLQASPAAKGLFHRVVGMSGSPFGEPMSPSALAMAEADGVRLQEALKLGSIEAMRDVPGDRIIAVPFPRRSPITIDRHVVPGGAPEIFGSGRQNDVPVMIGYTRDESFGSIGPVTSLADYRAAVARAYPESADAILAAYPAGDDAAARRAAVDIARDGTVGSQMANWAAAQARTGKAPVFAYFFTRRQPYAPGITFIDHDPATAGAYHTGDVPYWLGTLDSLNLFRRTRDWEAPDRQLAERMSSLIVAFARDGVPSAAGVPLWPRFDPERPRSMRLGFDLAVIDWPNYRALDLAKRRAAPPPPAASPRPRD